MNAISKLTSLQQGLLALSLAFILWLLFSGSEPTTSTANEQQNYTQASDYTISQFTITIMDENGQPSRIIKGQEMTHFPEDDSTHITSPIAEFVNQQKDTWIVTSEQGKTHGKGHVILLTDNVIISRKDDDKTELQTSTLTLDTNKSTAYTDAAVKMISPYGETNSIGLHATLEDKTINLHSRVKGHYDAPPLQ
ncbi:MAG: LPS export ABC transporter periplasmic protein LptC [Gammaproteobacteria bacterium]|nr:LPS export ABC transporter periplasmic protein LptC [Gammaproteobacteria bacterium]